ncbi:MAG: hypothetical protein ABJF01_25555 [bacterium]
MKTVTVLSLLSSAALAATLSACKPAGDTASANGSVANAKAGSLEGPSQGDRGAMMGGAGGMANMAGMTSAAASDSMETRLRTMDMMSAAQIEAALPAHSRAAGDMLSRMSADVQGMHMSPTTSWSATTDSIRQDLSHMAGMTGDQMKAAMPAYHVRMTRLRDMHRQMMARPKT